MNAKKTPDRDADGRTQVRFTLPYLPASQVFLAGSFNDWDPAGLRLEESEDTGWTIQIPLPPGGHEYLFVVDGRWITDPNNPVTTPNPFGGHNSVIHITEPPPASTKKRRR